MTGENWCPFCRAPYVSMDPSIELCRGHSRPMVGYRFVPGTFSITPGVAATFPPALSGMLVSLFRRHLSGDFGELDREDVRANERAIATGERILSAYSVGDVKLYIITEADRSRTTLLLRNEY